MAATEQEITDLLRAGAKVFATVLAEPIGLEACAAILRKNGWTCTPPAAKAAPTKRRTRRG